MIEEIQRVQLGGIRRYKGLLGSNDTNEERILEDIILDVSSSKVILWGGEPTLRQDILQLLKQIKKKVSWLCIRTDGLVFQKPKLAKQLKNAGLDAVMIPMPSLQADLNTWILGKGFAKKALQAMRIAQAIGFEVIAEVLVTRSGMDRISQTVFGLIQQGITKFIVRPIEENEVETNSIISVLPRLGVLEKELKRALLIAEQQKAQIFFEGFSSCTFQNNHFPILQFADREYLLCRNIEHENCFVPQSYVKQFGWFEFYREEIDIHKIPFQLIEIRAEEASRSIRQHLVQIAQTRPTELHVLGDFQHEKLYSILRDVLRLAIPDIWLIGDLKPLLSISKMEWFRLKGLKGLGQIITEPIISAEILELFERTQRFEQRIYARVISFNDIALYDRFFREGKLPVPPHFILDGDWDILALLEAIKTLSPELQENFEELIPFCLGRGKPQRFRFNLWKGIRERERKSFWNVYPKMISCPKGEGCLDFAVCCGMMKEWEAVLQPTKKEG